MKYTVTYSIDSVQYTKTIVAGSNRIARDVAIALVRGYNSKHKGESYMTLSRIDRNGRQEEAI